MQEEGCTVDRAKDGVECVDMLEKAASGTYQIILMDVQMPVMNGYDAARVIRRMDDPQKANIPIVAMTANAFSEDRQAALDAGMNDHIAERPIDRNTTCKRIPPGSLPVFGRHPRRLFGLYSSDSDLQANLPIWNPRTRRYISSSRPSRARRHQRDDRITNAAHFSNSNVFRYNFSVSSKK